MTTLLSLTVTLARAASSDEAAPSARLEARSSNLLAVGLVHDDRMDIHLSRLLDNAPLRDAVVTVLLRGTLHPTTAEADGGYGMQSEDLRVPGAAAVVFQVRRGDLREDLQSTLQIGVDERTAQDKNGARQWGWWILNFAVCIGFLMLLSRRRRALRGSE